MNHSFPIRIRDNNQILSKLDLHQIENVIWLQLCPHENHIASVGFEVTVLEEGQKGSIFKAVCNTELVSGSIVESTSVAESKVGVIVSLGQQLWPDVRDRLKFEKTGVYRYFSAASNRLRRFGARLWRGPAAVSCYQRQTS